MRDRKRHPTDDSHTRDRKQPEVRVSLERRYYDDLVQDSKKRTELEDSYHQLEAKHAELQKTHEQLEKTHTALREKCRDQKNHMEFLERQYSEFQRSEKALQNENANLKGENANLKGENEAHTRLGKEMVESSATEAARLKEWYVQSLEAGERWNRGRNSQSMN